MSYPGDRIAHIFEATASTELIEVINETTRVEAKNVARRMAAVAELLAIRTVEAEALNSRLPKVAALLAEGRTDWRVV